MQVLLIKHMIICWYWQKISFFFQISIFWPLGAKQSKFWDIFAPHPPTPDTSSLHSGHLILTLRTPHPPTPDTSSSQSWHLILTLPTPHPATHCASSLIVKQLQWRRRCNDYEGCGVRSGRMRCNDILKFGPLSF